MKAPNLKILDQSCNWSQHKLSLKRVKVTTTVFSLDAASNVGNFAIETFQKAGYEVEKGAIIPVKRCQIDVEIIFKPKEAAF